MEWKGKKLKMIGDLMEHGINQCATREEALEFMRLYRAAQPVHAAVNIGYLSGYYGAKKAARIRDWFEVAHPIFGNRTPSPEEAFAAGKQIGQELKREGS